MINSHYCLLGKGVVGNEVTVLVIRSLRDGNPEWVQRVHVHPVIGWIRVRKE